jgi:hypothetical protein
MALAPTFPEFLGPPAPFNTVCVASSTTNLSLTDILSNAPPPSISTLSPEEVNNEFTTQEALNDVQHAYLMTAFGGLTAGDPSNLSDLLTKPIPENMSYNLTEFGLVNMPLDVSLGLQYVYLYAFDADSHTNLAIDQ